MIVTIEAHLGQRLEQITKMMCEIRKQYNCDVKTTFNDIALELLFCLPKPPQELEEEYHRIINEKREKYKNSPEGKKKAEKEKMLLENKKDRYNSMMGSLENIVANKNNLFILYWLKDFQPISDDNRLVIDTKKIIAVFNSHGYEADVNTGENFREDDADNYARYIIGQCLSMLANVGAIHGVVHKFIKTWQEMTKRQIFAKMQAHMRRRKLNREGLAQKLGITRQAINHWFKVKAVPGKRIVTINKVLRLGLTDEDMECYNV